jgi:hypothetical protein
MTTGHSDISETYVQISWVVAAAFFCYGIFWLGAEANKGKSANHFPTSILSGIAGILGNLPILIMGLIFAFMWPITVPVIIISLITGYESPAKKQLRIEDEKRLRTERENEEKRKRQEELVLAETRRRQFEEDQRVKYEARARKLWELYHSMSDGRNIIEMDGGQFEKFVGILFAKMGYDVDFTSDGADQGADLIIKKGVHKIAVQAKRWAAPVGNSAVQEVISGKMFYGCSQGIIITNSSFTKSARDLAQKDRDLKLIDGLELSELCKKYRREIVPEFSLEEWRKISTIAEKLADDIERVTPKNTLRSKSTFNRSYGKYR